MTIPFIVFVCAIAECRHMELQPTRQDSPPGRSRELSTWLA